MAQFRFRPLSGESPGRIEDKHKDAESRTALYECNKQKPLQPQKLSKGTDLPLTHSWNVKSVL